MNVLSMIKDRQIKAQRRFEAELMMAKAYRGVAYVDVHHDTPELPSQCSYCLLYTSPSPRDRG